MPLWSLFLIVYLHFQWNMWGRNWKKMHNISFISWKKGGGSALNIFSIFYTHHRIPNKHMMTINFDTITNNYEVIYVIKTVMKYYLKKIRYKFSSASSKYGSPFICWRHTWRDLVYEYSWAKSPMISGYEIRFGRKKILDYAYVLKNGVGRYNIFF
jgi:hypothetical protein